MNNGSSQTLEMTVNAWPVRGVTGNDPLVDDPELDANGENVGWLPQGVHVYHSLRVKNKLPASRGSTRYPGVFLLVTPQQWRNTAPKIGES